MTKPVPAAVLREHATKPMLLILLSLAGCVEVQERVAHPGDAPAVLTPADRPVASDSQVVRVRRATVDEVVLAVPAGDMRGSTGQCDNAFATEGSIFLRMRWSDDDGGLLRSLSARFDEDGRVASYSDLRGGVTNVRTVGRSEPGTAILLSFDSRTALVRNQGGEGEQGYLVPFEEALEVWQLDVPRHWLEELRDRCAGDTSLSG